MDESSHVPTPATPQQEAQDAQEAQEAQETQETREAPSTPERPPGMHRNTFKQESKLRKALVLCILGFSILAVILALVLCIGAWGEAESQWNEDLALVSWTETYIRKNLSVPDDEMVDAERQLLSDKLSVEIIWFVNGLCVNGTFSDFDLRCPIVEQPKTPFQLTEFVRLADQVMLEEHRDEGYTYVPYERPQVLDGSTIRLTYPALVVAALGAACVLTSWLMSGALIKIRKREDVKKMRNVAFAVLQLTACLCFCTAASLLLAASKTAAGILKKYTGQSRYVLEPRTVHVIAWIVFLSQVTAIVCAYGFFSVSKRLQKPERYRPEPVRPRNTARQGRTRNGPPRRSTARDEFVDTELPPYSQVDPLATGCRRQPDASGPVPGMGPEDVELRRLRPEDRSPTYREIEANRSPRFGAILHDTGPVNGFAPGG